MTILLLSCAVASADEPEELRLRVLCLYDGAEASEPHRTSIHRYLEGPANHLGLRFDYHDVSRSLPPDEALARSRGILTWFGDERLERAEDYLRWLGRAVREGKPAVILGGIGARERASGAPVTSSIVGEALGALGLELDPRPSFTNNPLRLEVVRKDPTWVEFERKLTGELRWFEGIRAREPKNADVLLELRRRDGRGGSAHAVVFTEQVAYVAPGYLRWGEPVEPYRSAWRVDPFRLLARGFRLKGLPRPDPTTVQGARVFYSQIDGDGFESLSRVERDQLCAEVMRDRILAKTRVPITIGLITAPFDPQGLGRERGDWREVARTIFLLPNVEVASHSHTHPFDWDSGSQIPYRPKGYRYDPVAEVNRSIEIIEEHLTPPGKRVEVMLWSGNCTPTPAAIAAVASRGLVNLNGGETRRDRHFPSASQLFPYSRLRGGQLQIHATNPNENVYTEGWSHGYARLRHVRETWSATDAPRRTHAANLFFHFYSAERRESLEALEGLFRHVRQQKTWIPLPASRYCCLVEGFLSARVRRLADDVFEVRDQGALRTLRFDDEPRALDLARSENVLGSARHNGALYVSLKDERPAKVALAARPERRPHLVRANVPLERFEVAGETVRLAAHGAPWGWVVLGGLRPGAAYRIGGLEGAKPLTVNPAGEIAFALHPERLLELEVAPR